MNNNDYKDNNENLNSENTVDNKSSQSGGHRRSNVQHTGSNAVNNDNNSRHNVSDGSNNNSEHHSHSSGRDGSHHSGEGHHSHSGSSYGNGHHSSHSGKKRLTKQQKKKRTITIVSIVAAVVVIIGIIGAKGLSDAKGMLKNANELKTEMTDMLGAVKSQDAEAANTAVLKLDNTTHKISKTLSSPLWKMASHIPVAGKYVKSVDTLIGLVEDASDDIIKPAVATMIEYPMSGLKVGDGFSVTTINAYLDLLEQIQPVVDNMTAKMKKVELPGSMGTMISSYSDKITSLMSMYTDYEDYIPLMKAFIGDGSDKVYLLAAQNTAEIRAAGGFPGSIGTIRVEEGVMSIGDFNPVNDVLATYPPDEANVTRKELKIFNDTLIYSRDASFDPDFERAAQIWALAYEAKHGESVDGVLSLTPTIIQKVLKISGPITLPDGTELNGDNAVSVLQYELYYKYLSDRNTGMAESDANDYVDGLFAETAKQAMAVLVSGFDFKRINEYVNMFDEGVEENTIMLWFVDEQEEQYAKDAGCSGNLNDDPANPEAGVFFSLYEPCKLGWFLNIDTEMSEPVINADGTRSYDITVTLTNTIQRSNITRAGGYILGGYDGGIRGFVHLFAPAGGTIGDFETNNGLKITTDEYDNLEVGYNVDLVVEAGSPQVIKYTVTTAEGVDTPLKIRTTPTLQAYR